MLLTTLQTTTQQMYAQMVYKDSRILELNNKILEQDKKVMDLQEFVSEKNEVIRGRDQVIEVSPTETRWIGILDFAW